MYKIVYLRHLNDSPKFECLNSSYKRCTIVRIHCYIDKAKVYKQCKVRNYHFFEKMTHGTQDKLIQCIHNNIINK